MDSAKALMLACPAAIKLIRPQMLAGNDREVADLATARSRREAEAASYLLTGRQVFDGEPVMQVVALHLPSAPVPPSQRGVAVPPEFEELVLRCLPKRPEDRPRSDAELDRRLAAVDVAPWTAEGANDWRGKVVHGRVTGPPSQNEYWAEEGVRRR